ncbi:Hypothetical Protein MfeM64YM_0980 [Mycoplasmopsis fermentans M64]|uniref:Uncharacterized protein n=1 Tax=Mycoplasmopsis fermentans (strain M64) TaxID=943945 RepID=A0AB32XD05_MYCFM|nr:Hypothetical Protein MfeM64YM_0980 [Mycoplasmopsis fermentans M64]
MTESEKNAKENILMQASKIQRKLVILYLFFIFKYLDINW